MQSPGNNQDCTKEELHRVSTEQQYYRLQKEITILIPTFAEIKDTEPFAFNCILIDLYESRHPIMTS